MVNQLQINVKGTLLNELFAFKCYDTKTDSFC